jgi:ABC-type sugar transport system permease subunit
VNLSKSQYVSVISVILSQSQSNLVVNYPSSTNTEPLPPPSSNIVSEQNYTVILSIKCITAISDKQFFAAFMAVTVVTVLFIQ